MAASATISSTFTIACTLDAPAAHVITNPGRAFRVVGVEVYNAGGTPDVTLAGAADIAATQQAATNAWKSLALTEANCEVAKDQNLTLTNANVSTTRVLIQCVASGGGQAVSIT